MAHILLNWEHLMDISKDHLISIIKFAFENLYRYGNEASTYKVRRHLEYLYDNPLYSNFLFIINIYEAHACCQLFRNPYNKTRYENKFISWREACLLVLPKLRYSFRSYLVLERYKDLMIYEAKNTCIGALLLGEKKNTIEKLFLESLYVYRGLYRTLGECCIGLENN